MVEYKKNKIVINGNEKTFNYDIRDVIEHNNKYYILLSIPFNQNEINNIYCLDEEVKFVWQSEDLNSLFPNLKNLPYEQMGINNDVLYASDFYGRNYKIGLLDGKIGECIIVK